MGSRHAPIALVIVAFFAIALAFCAALILSERAAHRVGSLAADVTENADPSVLHLVRQRDILADLHVDMLKYRGQLVARQPARLDIAAPLARLDREWRSYEATPMFPSERVARDQAYAQVDQLKAVLARITAASTIGNTQETLRLIDSEAPGAFRNAADSLMELALLNQQAGHTSALGAKEAQQASSRLTWWLGGAALAITILLAATVVLSLRTMDHLQAERDAILEQRAAEHEIFAARVVHDIRNPLAAVQLWIDRGKRGPEDGLRPALAHAEQGLKRSIQIVDDLYALARARGAPDGKEQKTPLKEAVRYAIDEVAPRAASAGIELSTEPIPEVAIAAAPGVVASVLSNLLSNAVNYAGRGARITVRASAAERVHVDIADNGVGIAPDVQERLFEPYTRGESSRKVMGLGLGLATVKQLVERSGGSCGVQSVQGLGSLFWFELPMVQT